jgi:predicted N-acetyltransferase YhbS
MHRLSPSDEALIARAGDVLAHAMVDDPAWVWILPDPELRARAVDFLENRILRTHVPFGHCWATTDAASHRVVAAAAWCPPGREPGMLSFIRQGMARAPFMIGLGAFRRLMHAQGVMKMMRRRYSPAPAFWFLHTLGVAVNAQGRGLGSESVREVLRQVVDPSGLPATVITSKPANLLFYRRAGFEVIHEETVGNEHGFSFWYLARPVPAGRT